MVPLGEFFSAPATFQMMEPLVDKMEYIYLQGVEIWESGVHGLLL